MMKKLFSAIALVAMLASCGGGTKPYTINGTVSIDGIADGDTISLGYSVDGSEYIPESYAVVKDGKFQFNGEVENCKLYYLVKHATEEPLTMLFLEGGNITADIANEKFSITGTKSNDLSTELQESLAGPAGEMQEKQLQLYLDTTLTEEQRQAIITELQTTSEKLAGMAKEFINGNIETMAGLFMLIQCADIFSNEELSALLDKVPEENKDTTNNRLFYILQEIQEQRNNPQDFSDYFKSMETDSTATEESAK